MKSRQSLFFSLSLYRQRQASFFHPHFVSLLWLTVRVNPRLSALATFPQPAPPFHPGIAYQMFASGMVQTQEGREDIEIAVAVDTPAIVLLP